MEQEKIRTKLYKDFDLSFAVNPTTGDLSKKLDVNAVKQSLRTLILTNYYERPFAPEKGANLRAMLFENISPLAANAMQKVIENLVNTYEPRAKLEDVVVRANIDNNAYDVSIYYYVVGFPQPQNLNTTLERLR